MSLGPDGKPAWDPADAKDGYPFYVAKVTDESVPDRDKDYVLLLNAHPAEPCGQEGSPRFLEDLLIWRDDGPRPRARRRRRACTTSRTRSASPSCCAA